MREYSPKRRTALVFTGSGSTGAYHAGALKALDESGVKLDLVVGSGAGTLAAAFAAVAGGARLSGEDGFWRGLGFGSLFRLRAPLRVAAVLLMAAFVVFLLPLVLALFAGLLFPLLLIVDLLAPGWPAGAEAADEDREHRGGRGRGRAEHEPELAQPHHLVHQRTRAGAEEQQRHTGERGRHERASLAAQRGNVKRRR